MYQEVYIAKQKVEGINKVSGRGPRKVFFLKLFLFRTAESSYESKASLH